jgi:hypothetical protein
MDIILRSENCVPTCPGGEPERYAEEPHPSLRGQAGLPIRAVQDLFPLPDPPSANPSEPCWNCPGFYDVKMSPAAMVSLKKSGMPMGGSGRGISFSR